MHSLNGLIFRNYYSSGTWTKIGENFEFGGDNKILIGVESLYNKNGRKFKFYFAESSDMSFYSWGKKEKKSDAVDLINENNGNNIAVFTKVASKSIKRNDGKKDRSFTFTYNQYISSSGGK